MNAGELTLPIREAAGHNFEEILARHQQRVLGTAYRLLGRMEDAQDASQEVFLRLYAAQRRLQGNARVFPGFNQRPVQRGEQ